MTKLLTFMISMLLVSGFFKTTVAHQEQKIELNQQLQLKVVDDTFALEYKGDLTNEFGTVNRAERIKSLFISECIKYLTKSMKFKIVHYNSEPIEFSSSKFACDLYRNRNIVDSLNFSIPESPLLDSTDLTLFLENITIKSPVHVCANFINLFPVAVPNKSLIIESKYLFWNNRANKAVAWGVIRTGDGELDPYVDIGTWRASVGKYTFRILEKVTFNNELRNKTTDSVINDSFKNASDAVTDLKPLRFNQFRNKF
jgi:hypothetical protein